MPWAQGCVALVALFGVVFYLFIVARVGAARLKYKVMAPATTGDPKFERVFRVQQNTLENLPVFLVGLYFFATYLNALAAAIIGAIWIVGRIIYMQTYIADPSKRSIGAMITFLAEIVLVAGGIFGVVMAILPGLQR